MTVAELFVNIGIKGNDKAVQAMGGVNTGLKNVGSSSLAAKAAILGVIYGLERMMSASAAQGNNLMQFANFTGLSADKLQRWQYAARQSMVSADDMQGSIVGLQGSMSKMIMTGQAPDGRAAVANITGADFEHRARDTMYIMDKLREYAQKTADSPDISNQMLASFGLSPAVIQMLRTSKVDLDKINPSNFYSKADAGQLQKVGVAWENLGAKAQKLFGNFTAKHGLGIVSEISKITEQVFRMIEAFELMAEKVKIFQFIGSIFEGWGLIFKLINDTLGSVNDKVGNDKKPKEGKGTKKPSEDGDPFIEALSNTILLGRGLLKDDNYKINRPKERLMNVNTKTLAEPLMKKPVKGASISPVTNTNVAVNNYGVPGVEDAAEHFQRAINFAYRQSPAQSLVG